jgi:hypothetical protein
MKTMRRPSGSLLFSIGTHVVLGILILNAAFHYDFSNRGLRPASPLQEHVTYVATAPGGAAVGGSTLGVPARATEPSPGLVAPARVPSAIISAPPTVGGTPGGVDGGLGTGGGVGPVTGIVPADPDPRLATDPHAFFPAPKTHAQRVDSAVKAIIYAFNDSVEKANATAGKKPGDWTFEKGGQKWGIDGSKIYLGKFAIPSAVLAALPIRIQGNPGEAIADRLSGSRRSEVLVHAQSQAHDDEFRTAVKRIRERKDAERRERMSAATADGSAPEGHDRE